MTELPQSPEAAGWLATALAALSTLFWKYMPAPLGAAVMILFDTPKTRKELFTRLAVSYVFGSMFAQTMFDLLHSFSLFSFLDVNNRRHFGAVEFFTASIGWTVLAAFATLQRKVRENPGEALQQARDIAKP